VDFVGSFGNDDTITIKATYEDWIVIADDLKTGARILEEGIDRAEREIADPDVQGVGTVEANAPFVKAIRETIAKRLARAEAIYDMTTTRCLDCGVDTEISGYVNRVPADKAWIDGYICGPCGDTFDGANDDGDDPWDALDAYLPARIAEVDNADPTAAEFRRWFKRQDGEERTSGQVDSE